MDSLSETYRPLREHYKNLWKPETTPQITSLMLETTQSRDGSPAPATRLVGRTLRMLVPKLELTNFENKPKRYDSKYIDTGQTLIPLKEGDKVRIRDTLKNNWMRKAKVIEEDKSPRSYVVKTEDGNHLRNNRSHLLLTKSHLQMVA